LCSNKRNLLEVTEKVQRSYKNSKVPSLLTITAFSTLYSWHCSIGYTTQVLYYSYVLL